MLKFLFIFKKIIYYVYFTSLQLYTFTNIQSVQQEHANLLGLFSCFEVIDSFIDIVVYFQQPID